MHSPEALQLAASFLEDEQLKGDAAYAAAASALPPEGSAQGLAGPDVRPILQKAVTLLADDPYFHEMVEKYLETLEQTIPPGFVSLFNGRDLSGWKGLVGDPPGRARMNAAELARRQAEANERMRAHWSACDHVLVFDGRGENICTAGDYTDFELLVDWKIEKGGDSGIYLRGSPQVQIWNPAQWPEGSGGLYNNQKNPNKPRRRADRPVGEWNSFRIRMVGERVSVWLNGQAVVEGVPLENYWERDKPIYPSGSIELQAHGAPLYFRNIYIRDLRSDAQAQSRQR